MALVRIVMAQVNPLVGDIDGNTALVIERAEAASQLGADVVVFPELSLTGYPPEDLLLRPSIKGRIEQAIAILKAKLPSGVYVVLGFPHSGAEGLFNSAGLFYGGDIIAEYHKQHLPNYRVFDEKRYFVPGHAATVVPIRGIPMAISICEDIWEAGTMQQAREAGAKLMLNLNASPFHVGKQEERVTLLQARVAEGDMPIVYVNQVGAQDELVFDGGSMAVDRDGVVKCVGAAYEEALYCADINAADLSLAEGNLTEPQSRLESVYNALVLGVREYVNNNGFKGAVLGLSGGIDSALTLAIAVDALGAERVSAVMMPFRYTSQMSEDDAAEQARALGVNFSSISIEPIFETFMQALKGEFAGAEKDTTEENLQARCRGVLLMAISNKKGYLVLTTGNKSEMAVGYSTLYGDMAGGFDALKDVPKMLVYELAGYRNTLSAAIPQRVIDRPPSAELAPDQRDEDSLPPYEELDRILELYIEQDYSANAIIAQGFDADVVKRVIRLVDINEYKRRQAPIGVRITQRGFGRDRRYPITSGWVQGD